MPTLTLYRLYCVDCKDYTICVWNDTSKKYVCKTCKQPILQVAIEGIAQHKARLQRDRYKKSQQWKPGFLQQHNPFAEVGSDIQIIEDPAGQLEIDKQRELQWTEAEERLKQLQEEALKYKRTQRNEKCPCGSGKKYKHCHASKFQGV